MKLPKYIIASTVILCFLLLFNIAGCSSKTSDNDAENSTGLTMSQIQSDVNNNRPGQFAQRQMEQGDLSGEIASVTGDEITVKLIAVSDMRANGAGPGSNPNNPNKMPDNQNNPQSGDANSANGSNTLNANGEQPQRPNRSQGGGFPMGEIEYTGETETLKLNGEVELITFSLGENGMETQALEITDLKEGDFIQIWYADKENKVVFKISVISGQTSK